MSKGSKPRPLGIDQKIFDDNFERIFGKKKNKEDSNADLSDNTSAKAKNDKA